MSGAHLMRRLARDKAAQSMPETAAEVARVAAISREDADETARRSHRHAAGTVAAAGGRYGLATMCVGVGRGTAMIVERVDV